MGRDDVAVENPLHQYEDKYGPAAEFAEAAQRIIKRDSAGLNQLKLMLRQNRNRKTGWYN